MQTYNFIDLFAGCGGLSEGFIRAGFSPVAHIEMDLAASNSLRTRMCYHWLIQNKKEKIYFDYLKKKISRKELYELVPNDIINSVINEEISKDSLDNIFNEIDVKLKGKPLTLIIGGPPCQAYSLIGRSCDKNNMKNDKRNYLYKYYAEFLKRYQPEYFVFENVTGLLSAKDKNGKLHFENMMKLFKKCGYSCIHKTLNAKDYGELDIETVDVMPCGNDTIHEQKRVARPVGMQGEGNLQGDGVESLEQRYDFDYDSGKDQNGTPNKAHAIAHGATELMEEGEGRENGVIADEDTEIPGTSLTYGDLAKFTGVTIQELVEHEGEAEVSIMDRAQEIEEKIKEAAEENKMSIEGYKKELKKAPGKNIEETIENANGAILEQYMGSSGRGR